MGKHRLIVKIDLPGKDSAEEYKSACGLAYRILTDVLYAADPQMVTIVDETMLSKVYGAEHINVPCLCDHLEAFDAGVTFDIQLKGRRK